MADEIAGISSFGQRVSFRDVVLRGYAPDGGMILPLPARLAALADATLRRWTALAFDELLAELVVHLLCAADAKDKDGDFVDAIRAATRDGAQRAGAPMLCAVGELHVGELSHGPSLAFKDFGLQVVAAIIDCLVARSGGQRRALLVATSGDTGAAALEAFQNRDNATITVLLPAGRVAPLQERQMTRVGARNTRVFRVANATSDTLDHILVELFNDQAFVDECNLGSVNSINLIRIVAQMAHYFALYGQMVARGSMEYGDKLRFVVPTGALGNATAGVLCRKLGLNCEIVCANTAANAATVRLVDDGVWESLEATTTIAPAIDITAPYNLERLMCLAVDGDLTQMKSIMTVRTHCSIPSQLTHLHTVV